MSWFRNKKFPAIEDLAGEDQWMVAQGEHDGRPMLVRVNTSAKAYAGHPGLPVRLGIAVPFHAPRADGMPEKAESQQLGAIEDRVFEVLGTGGRVVLVITTGGMREFVSYVRSREIAAELAQAVKAATTTHEVQHYVDDDPAWKVYQQFV